ncbi:MAG: glutathione S-transferase family protein [Alphaproteobacteria bacterium]|nr:glutathione S-transferase family protein [Alphaproteobacteria bacterium]
MMYTLYYSPGACSLAVHVVLNELGVKFEAVKKSTKDGSLKTPEFLKINPRGQVPVLVVDDTPIREGAAMITYLLDTHKSPMLPSAGLERAHALQWIMWANASLHPAYSRAFWLMGQKIDDATRATLQQSIFGTIQSFWDEAETRLGESKFLGGDTLGAADILIAVFANWGVGHEFKLGPNVQRVIKAVIALPSWQKAVAAEQIEYKAVA